MPTSTFFHYLLSTQHNTHTLLRWGERLPHKIDVSIFEDKERFVDGWGIYIIEGLDKVYALLVALFILLTSGLIAVVWTITKDDVQGGFGIGSWVLSVQAVLVALVVARWNEI